ncbi:MAG: 2-oxo acid dehydrogenase subunit E2 [Elusimicrobiota bacterium]|jgi:pyruvate dehydrogenase E2 component (dihydrolipoamide acetyltransferase)|nr:2-oxo acid dehydrogenase subunit E2 [Elusimicrobiota bacterium]
MVVEIKMPQLGLTMVEGTISAWLKQVGDEIKKGDPIVEITTDKLNNILESETDGFLLSINAPEGADVPVMGILGYIGQPGEKVPTTAQTPSAQQAQQPPAAAQAIPQENAASQPQAQQVAENVEPPAAAEVSGKRIKISPLAKKTALNLGININQIAGSGPGGRIVQKDILGAPPQKSSGGQVFVSKPPTRQRLSSMRKAVGTRMLASHSQIPCVTINVKVDVSELFELRAKLNANREKEKKFTVNDFIIKACAKTLASHKELIVSLSGEDVVYNQDINIGMAVALEAGLIAPVIRHADKLSLEEISIKAKDLAARARKGQLGVEEYQGSTFSISNLGMYQGVETFTSIINQPNAGILGVGSAISELDILADGSIVKKLFMRIAVTIDHRLLDGAQGAKFGVDMKKLLENPIEILV